jgi:hypothetical protein
VAAHLREIGQFLTDCFKLCFGVLLIAGSFAIYARYIAYVPPVDQYRAGDQPVILERASATCTEVDDRR